MLVRGDRAIAGGGAQFHGRAKPSDDVARSGCFGPASAGTAGWPNCSGRSFPFRDDRHRSGYAFECFGPCLCGSTSAGCGEDYAALAKRFPPPPASAGIIFDGDEGRLSEEVFLRDFAGDLPAAKAKVLYAVQQPFQKSLLTGRTTQAAWRSKPSFYAVSTQDRTINPDLERFMAKRMGAKTIEVMASHLSLLTSRRDYQADPGSRTAGLTRGQSRLTLSGATAFLRLRTIGRLSSRPAVRASRTSHRGIDG
jgi:hypothetical protein